jgi:hypothetical protein
MLEDIVPNEAGRGIGQRIVSESVAPAVTAEGLFQVIRAITLGAPGMAVRGIHAVAIKVVEQHILLRQRMMIGRNESRINAELGVAIALRKVAKHLIVGLVFFEDINDVLKYGGFARSPRDRDGDLARQRRLLGLFNLWDAAVLERLGGVFA